MNVTNIVNNFKRTLASMGDSTCLLQRKRAHSKDTVESALNTLSNFEYSSEYKVVQVCMGICFTDYDVLSLINHSYSEFTVAPVELWQTITEVNLNSVLVDDWEESLTALRKCKYLIDNGYDAQIVSNTLKVLTPIDMHYLGDIQSTQHDGVEALQEASQRGDTLPILIHLRNEVPECANEINAFLADMAGDLPVYLPAYAGMTEFNTMLTLLEIQCKHYKKVVTCESLFNTLCYIRNDMMPYLPLCYLLDSEVYDTYSNLQLKPQQFADICKLEVEAHVDIVREKLAQHKYYSNTCGQLECLLTKDTTD